jgi:hypothetical protein
VDLRLEPIDGGTLLTLALADPGDRFWQQAGPDFVESIDTVMADLERVVQSA